MVFFWKRRVITQLWERNDVIYVPMSYLHEPELHHWEPRSAFCRPGFNVVCSLRIVHGGFTDVELLKVMSSAFKRWRPSLLNNS